ncbi:MAG: hypothetical protein ACLQDL_02645 [Spirochaetia bacterium]
MKMRKLLPLVLVAVGALFLLSGCDAMLDAIFPSNQIYVDVQVSAADYPFDWSDAYNHGSYPGSVTLYLYDVSANNTTVATGTWTSVDYNYIHFPFVFTKLKNDVYQLTAVYTSRNYSPPPFSDSVFYDPSGVRMGSPVSAISLPYPNSGDGTGHSVNLSMYF